MFGFHPNWSFCLKFPSEHASGNRCYKTNQSGIVRFRLSAPPRRAIIPSFLFLEQHSYPTAFVFVSSLTHRRRTPRIREPPQVNSPLRAPRTWFASAPIPVSSYGHAVSGVSCCSEGGRVSYTNEPFPICDTVLPRHSHPS
jgi:hypothetical protein